MAEAASTERTRVRLLVFLRAINLFSLLRRGRTCGRYGLHSPVLSVARYTSGRKRWPRSFEQPELSEATSTNCAAR